ncbi:MAG: indole-3-glycerol phosphate synthase TrpC [Patescibacteria group bacterium]
MEKPVPILEKLSASSREQAMVRKREVGESELFAKAERWRNREGSFADALGRPGLSVIAEHKRRSPSRGMIREDWGVVETIAAYEWGGARAISLLTEETRFGGSLDHLRKGREVTDLPLLRKDFITDHYQLLEAKAAGADAALLIVGALEDDELSRLSEYADSIGLDVLVEVHDAEELERAVAVRPKIIGVNNRNLRDPELTTDTGLTATLLGEVPDGTLVVTESGFQVDEASRALLSELRNAGVDGVLIGEHLMRAEDPEAAVRYFSE